MNLDRKRKKVHASAFIAETAVVLGDVAIGRESSVWFHTVVRGDVASITIGERTNIQDGAVVHADPGYPASIVKLATRWHPHSLGERSRQGISANGALLTQSLLISGQDRSSPDGARTPFVAVYPTAGAPSGSARIEDRGRKIGS